MNLNEKVEQSFKKLGLRIKKLREEQNINIKDLSEKTGIRKEYLRKIENGNAYGATLERHLVKISKTLKVKLSDFFNFN